MSRPRSPGGQPSPIQATKADVSQFLRVARERHRRGEDAFRVVQGLSDGIDGVIRHLYTETLQEVQGDFAVVAVGGYGRRELCPYSDIDLLFLTHKSTPQDKLERLERLVRNLWDGGFQLGQSVRTAQDCFRFMVEDHITASTMLENRFLAGSRSLYEQFEGVAINRFRKRKTESFARQKIEQLRLSLEGEDRTFWVLEPHLKDGCCTLRDIQRVLWIEGIRRGHTSFDALAQDENFETEAIESLRAAYGFYLRLRCELHFSNNLKQDILERDSVVDIARGLGYTGTPQEVAEGLMGDYFRHARESARFLRRYLETGTRGKRFFAKLSRKILRNEPKPYLVNESGVLFPAAELPAVDSEHAEDLAAEIMDIFLLAQREEVLLSETLIRSIRVRLESFEFDFAHSSLIGACFLEIMRGKRAARSLKAMHRAGLLSRVLPEFAAIDGLVSFGGHHQFTVDAHTLRTLVELDRVEAGDESVPIEFRNVVGKIKDLFPLRLALLLHDIGKGIPEGDHSVTGVEASRVICERLGLPEDVTELVEFLVYRHLALFKVSQRRDYNEPGVAESFSRVVRSENRLNMLYLLTYIDVSSVGAGTWTSWKGAQLAELHALVRQCFREEESKVPEIEELVLASSLDDEKGKLVIEHCRRVEDSSYVRDILPERLLDHARLVQELQSCNKIQVGYHNFGGYFELAVACRDRAHVFADVAGVLFVEGLNLLGARILSRDDGVALDVFNVEVVDDVRVDMSQRVEAIQANLRDIENNDRSVDELIRDWVRSYKFRKLRKRRLSLHRPTVKIDNEASELCSVIEVVAPDRPGLLFDLSHAISTLGLNVRAAKVSTLADRCRDVFYVCEADGSKIQNPARSKQIEQLMIEESCRPTTAMSEGELPEELDI